MDVSTETLWGGLWYEWIWSSDGEHGFQSCKVSTSPRNDEAGVEKFAIKFLYLEKGVCRAHIPFLDSEKILSFLLGAHRDHEGLKIPIEADVGPNRGKTGVF